MTENLPKPHPHPDFDVFGLPREEQLGLCGARATGRVISYGETPREAARNVAPLGADEAFIEEVAESTHPVVVQTLRGMAKELAAWRAVDE